MSRFTFCQWFARCSHPAAGTVMHPVLGAVPTCERCARVHGLQLDELPGSEIPESQPADLPLEG